MFAVIFAQTKLHVLRLAFFMQRGFFLSQPKFVSSAAQPASDSIAAQSASAVEELALDDDGPYDLVSELRQAVLPRIVTLPEWVHRISSAARLHEHNTS